MAQFGNSMRVRYIPIAYRGNEIHLSGDSTKKLFPATIVVFDEDMSDEYYLELNFKKVAPRGRGRLLIDVTDVTLYNKAGDVMEYYHWNPNDTSGVWHHGR